MSMSCRVRRPLFAGLLFAGQPVKGLPGPALRGLGVAGLHPHPREVGPRPGEPLLEITDLRLEPVLVRERVSGGGGGRSHQPFGIVVLLPAAGRTFRRLPRQPLGRFRLPPRGGLSRRLRGSRPPSRRGAAAAAPGRPPARLGVPAPVAARAARPSSRRARAADRRLPPVSPASAPGMPSAPAVSGSTPKPDHCIALVSVPRRSPPRPRDPPARRSASASPRRAATAARRARQRPERAWLVSASTSAPRAADSSRSRGPCPACCARAQRGGQLGQLGGRARVGTGQVIDDPGRAGGPPQRADRLRRRPVAGICARRPLARRAAR